MSVLKSTKTPVVKQHESREESLQQEIKLDDIKDQWGEMKNIYTEGINTTVLEQQLLQRENEAIIERKKVFDEINAQKMIREANEYERILEMERKIKNKKKIEIKRRDIAFRNRSVLG